MKRLPKFREFAEAKDQGLADKKSATKVDQSIPKAEKPEMDLNKSLAGKDYKGNLATAIVKGKNEVQPYKNLKNIDSGVVKVAAGDVEPKDGLAFKNTPGITPKTSSLGEEPELKTKKMKAAKLTSEEFVEQTKNLSPKEFLDFFTEGSDEPLPTITDLYGNEFTPDPNQTIQYMASLMVKNPKLVGRFVREMKRQNGMSILIDESQEHPEFYNLLVEGMNKPEHGKKRCSRIAKAMNENYMNELSKFMMEQKLNEEVQKKEDLAFEDGGPALGKPPENPSGMKFKKQKGGAFGGGNDPAQGPLPGGSMGGGGAGMGGPQGPMPGGSFGGGGAGMGVDAGDGDAGMPGAGPDAMPAGMNNNPPSMPPAGGPSGFDNGQGMGGPAPKMPKLKGETAHGNMIEAMGSFPHIKDHMTSHCLNGNCDK